MGFSRRPLTPGDVRDWVELLAAIQHADRSDEFPSEQHLREAFGHPDQDFASGSMAIYDSRTIADELRARGVQRQDRAS